ncbi:MAG: TetR family transcriptional regulator [Lachnospiraceae bacterium]|nr:TetR family transcriptional regulator [Lachnospiraceae bacterium]
MDFQRARTPEQIENRQNEIILACKEIYEKDGYDAVTMKGISEMTSFTRPAIYGYYKTKEEIFMDILKEEFSLWSEDFQKRCQRTNDNSRETFCSLLADSMCDRTVLLELLSVHLNTMENNTRLERLVEFKKTVYQFFDILRNQICCFFSDADEEHINDFFDHFIIYLNGLYPHIVHSEIQKQAMTLAGRPPVERNLRHVCYNGLLLISKSLINE